MLELYIGGTLPTAAYLLLWTPGPKPQGVEWLHFALMVVLWPLLFLFAVYWAVRNA